MRRGAWLIGLLLVISCGTAAAGKMTPVHGDIEHRLGALLEGQVSTGPSSVLSSVAAGHNAPTKVGFQLQAERAQATIVRITQEPSERTALSTLPLALDSDIEQYGEEVEHHFFRDLAVRPLEATQLWNLVAFAHPDDRFDVLLPAGQYTLGQEGGRPSILRPEVPRTQTLKPALDPALAATDGSLELRADALSATYRGDFLVLLYGASFEFASPEGNERIQAGTYDEIHYQFDGLIPERRTVNAIVLVRVESGVMHVQAGDASLSLHARAVQLDGRATFVEPTGTLEWDGRSEPARGHQTIEGQFQIISRGPAYERDGQRVGPLTIQGLALAPTVGLSPGWVWGAAAASTLAAAAVVRWIPGVRRLAFAAVAGFSLVQKDEALEHRARSQLYDYVRGNPGTTLTIAQGHLGLGWGTVEYHVAVLERLGLLVTKRAGGKRLLFASGQGRIVDPRAWSLLRNPSVRQLAATILLPGAPVTQVQIAQALQCSTQYAGRLVRKLCEAGLLAPATDAARRAFVSTELLQDLARRSGVVAGPSPETVTLEAAIPA